MLLFQTFKPVASAPVQGGTIDSKLRAMNQNEKFLRTAEEIEKAMLDNWTFARTVKAVRSYDPKYPLFIRPDISKEQSLAESLFTRDYLGDILFEQSRRAPAKVMVLDPSFSRALEGGFGFAEIAGYYLPGTNVVLLRDPKSNDSSTVLDSLWNLVFPKEDFGLGSKKYSELELTLIEQICHELHHRYSYERGIFGGVFGFSYGQSRTHFPPAWLTEGITEFLSLRLLASNQIPVPNSAYIKETGAIHLLSQLVEPGIIKLAYFSGDFTQVMASLDEKLGAGSFEKLINFRDCAKAIDYLEGQMDEKNIKFAKWDENAANLGPASATPKR